MALFDVANDGSVDVFLDMLSKVLLIGSLCYCRQLV